MREKVVKVYNVTIKLEANNHNKTENIKTLAFDMRDAMRAVIRYLTYVCEKPKNVKAIHIEESTESYYNEMQ